MMRPRIAGRWLAAAAAALALAATSIVLVAPTANAATVVQYRNPLAEQRADTHIYKHTDGYYYLTATVPEYDRIILRRATTLQGLSSAEEKVIWRKHDRGIMGAHIWAPEIHFINGKWYIYFAAGASNAIWAIRMYALEATGANPLTASWVEKGQIQTGWESFALDASTFVHDSKRYLIWAQKNGPENSNVYIARLKADEPWVLDSQATMIAKPTLSWERRGGVQVNEGPTVIIRNGRIFLTYSASATDANYCLGLLTASAAKGVNLLDAKSWTKNPDPVFVSNTATSQYGPGHNSFTVAEDGRSDILVYHARNYRNINGDPLKDPNRHTRIQKLYWNADGTPNFGIPVPDGVTPVRLRSHNQPDRYLRHWEFRVRLDADVTNLADSQFRIVPGLADPKAISLESTNFPGYFLRHRDFGLWVERNDNSAVFKADASFVQRPGLADADKVSLESVNFPGQFVRHQDGLFKLSTVPGKADRADATFELDPSVPTTAVPPTPTVTPTVQPTGKPTAKPTGAAGGGSAGAARPAGGLPVTGADVAVVGGGGAVLTGVGVVLFAVARRRRTRFSADGN